MTKQGCLEFRTAFSSALSFGHFCIRKITEARFALPSALISCNMTAEYKPRFSSLPLSQVSSLIFRSSLHPEGSILDFRCGRRKYVRDSPALFGWLILDGR